jgi:hypothetical protein
MGCRCGEPARSQAALFASIAQSAANCVCPLRRDLLRGARRGSDRPLRGGQFGVGDVGSGSGAKQARFESPRPPVISPPRTHDLARRPPGRMLPALKKKAGPHMARTNSSMAAYSGGQTSWVDDQGSAWSPWPCLRLYCAVYDFIGKEQMESQAPRVHSTVTLLAKLRGLSTSVPLAQAV